MAERKTGNLFRSGIRACELIEIIEISVSFFIKTQRWLRLFVSRAEENHTVMF